MLGKLGKVIKSITDSILTGSMLKHLAIGPIDKISFDNILGFFFLMRTCVTCQKFKVQNVYLKFHLVLKVCLNFFQMFFYQHIQT